MLFRSEDIAKSFSRLNLEIQGLNTLQPYKPSLVATGALTTASALKTIIKQYPPISTFAEERLGVSPNSDDCENCVQCLFHNLKTISKVCGFNDSAVNAINFRLAGAAAGSAATPCAEDLAAKMQSVAQGDPLFAACTNEHHAQMAKVIFRLGKMMNDGLLTAGFSAVSAKAAEIGRAHV